MTEQQLQQLKPGNRVCLKDTGEWGVIAGSEWTAAWKGEGEWLVLLDNRHSIWQHEDNLLPVEVTVVEAIANEYGDVFWEEGRLPLGMRYAGSTVRITIERVHERG